MQLTKNQSGVSIVEVIAILVIIGAIAWWKYPGAASSSEQEKKASLTEAAVKNVDQKEPPAEPAKRVQEILQNGNSVIEYVCDADTEFERKKREKSALLKDYYFTGLIDDIKDERQLSVNLNPSLIFDATKSDSKRDSSIVHFAEDIGSSLRKSQAIKFKGNLSNITCNIDTLYWGLRFLDVQNASLLEM